jgi:hypothetical protein
MAEMRTDGLLAAAATLSRSQVARYLPMGRVEMARHGVKLPQDSR